MSAPTDEWLADMIADSENDVDTAVAFGLDSKAEHHRKILAALVELRAARRTLAKARAEVEPVARLAEKATPGPWRADNREPGDVVIWGPREEWFANVGNWARQNPEATAEEVARQFVEVRDMDDATLIVSARNLIPRLARVLDGEE